VSLKLICVLTIGALLACAIAVDPHATVFAADPPAAEKGEAPHKAEHGAGGHSSHIGEQGVSKDPSELRQDLAIFTFIVFLLLMAILWKFAWGPISAALDKREEGIRRAIEEAELGRQQAQQMLADHAAKLDQVQDEVREILAEARRDAEHTKQDILNTAQKEAEAAKQRAVQDIERARDSALHELFDAMANQVANATEHVLGRTVNDKDHERLIQEALAQFPRN
jgi:F-type H+-transporting ATPase subunit b